MLNLLPGPEAHASPQKKPEPRAPPRTDAQIEMATNDTGRNISSRPDLALAALLVAVATRARSQPRERIEARVLQWNILAREYTGYNDQSRRPATRGGPLDPRYLGHGNGLADPLGLETLEQTARRFSLATDALLRQSADAVLLQECAPAFFSRALNPRAEALLDRYRLFPGFEDEPGTAILLLKPEAGGALLEAPGLGVQHVGGTGDTGGKSKGALLVPVIPAVAGAGWSAESAVWLASLHLAPPRFDPQGASRQHRLLQLALDRTPRAVVAGDFNAEAAELEALGWFRRMKRVPAPAAIEASGTATTWHAATPRERGELIDHCYLSEGIRVVGDASFEKLPSSPYSAASGGVSGASDHVWMAVRLALFETRPADGGWYAKVAIAGLIASVTPLPGSVVPAVFIAAEVLNAVYLLVFFPRGPSDVLAGVLSARFAAPRSARQMTHVLLALSLIWDVCYVWCGVKAGVLSGRMQQHGQRRATGLFVVLATLRFPGMLVLAEFVDPIPNLAILALRFMAFSRMLSNANTN